MRWILMYRSLMYLSLIISAFSVAIAQRGIELERSARPTRTIEHQPARSNTSEGKKVTSTAIPTFVTTAIADQSRSTPTSVSQAESQTVEILIPLLHPTIHPEIEEPIQPSITVYLSPKDGPDIGAPQEANTNHRASTSQDKNDPAPTNEAIPPNGNVLSILAVNTDNQVPNETKELEEKQDSKEDLGNTRSVAVVDRDLPPKEQPIDNTPRRVSDSEFSQIQPLPAFPNAFPPRPRVGRISTNSDIPIPIPGSEKPSDEDGKLLRPVSNSPVGHSFVPTNNVAQNMLLFGVIGIICVAIFVFNYDRLKTNVSKPKAQSLRGDAEFLTIQPPLPLLIPRSSAPELSSVDLEFVVQNAQILMTMSKVESDEDLDPFRPLFEDCTKDSELHDIIFHFPCPEKNDVV